MKKKLIGNLKCVLENFRSKNMFDEIDDSKAIKIEGHLRFDTDLLKIKYNNKWMSIPKTGEFKGIPVILEDILFDTGNEAGYCVIIGAFMDSFQKKFPQITFKTKTRNFLISEEREEFKFNETIKFKTLIGFKFGEIASNWINTVNVGIDSIIQFTSILYPIDILNSKCKYLCFHKK